MKTKKVYWVLTVIFAAAFCTFVEVQAQTKIRIGWDETDPKTANFIKETVAEYKQKTGVEVVPEIIPSDDLWQKVQASISVGRPYELATLSWKGWAYILAERNQLEPLDEIIADYGKGDFLPKVLLEHKGKQWWVPYDYNVGMLYYRTDLLKQKGIAVPKNWDELLKAAKALTEGDQYGIALCLGENSCNSLLMTPFLWGPWRGAFWQELERNSGFTTDKAEGRGGSKFLQRTTQIHASWY